MNTKINMEFKEGDKVMGIHTDLGYVGLVCGKIIQVERIGEAHKPLRYIIKDEEYQFSGILNNYEVVKYDGFRLMEIKIFWEKREKLLGDAKSKLEQITRLINETAITK